MRESSSGDGPDAKPGPGITPPSILAGSAALRLFAMLRHTIDAERLADQIELHLGWMIEREKEGNIFLSGPTERGEAGDLDGLTILRCADLTEATRLASEDPLVQSGCVRFEIYPWTVFEGSLRLTVTLSDSKALIL